MEIGVLSYFLCFSFEPFIQLIYVFQTYTRSTSTSDSLSCRAERTITYDCTSNIQVSIVGDADAHAATYGFLNLEGTYDQAIHSSQQDDSQINNMLS